MRQARQGLDFARHRMDQRRAHKFNIQASEAHIVGYLRRPRSLPLAVLIQTRSLPLAVLIQTRPLPLVVLIHQQYPNKEVCMLSRFVLVGILACLLVSSPAGARSAATVAITPISIYGAWHCGDDFCTWSSVRDLTEFDSKNRWLIDRGDGLPSVNLVILSFVHPLRLLNKTTDSQTLLGVPRGMTQEIVNYFKDRNIRVMLSIGGITYVDPWNQALSANAAQLGLNAAEGAQSLGVGIEIDYEENRNANVADMEAFIDADRSVLPYDPTGTNLVALLTIDLGGGYRFLICICRKATSDWLNTSTPVLDYANAMVPNRQPSSSGAIANWREHVDGKPQFGPPILPLAPAKFTGSLYIVTGRKAAPECVNFAG